MHYRVGGCEISFFNDIKKGINNQFLECFWFTLPGSLGNAEDDWNPHRMIEFPENRELFSEMQGWYYSDPRIVPSPDMSDMHIIFTSINTEIHGIYHGLQSAYCILYSFGSYSKCYIRCLNVNNWFFYWLLTNEKQIYRDLDS